MYKISINETPVFFINQKDLATFPYKKENTLAAPYMGKPKILLSYADMMEKGTRFDNIILYAPDEKVIFKDFKEHYQVIKAAGGLVFNEKNQILAILRLGFWDLPKGKIDAGEKKKAAAIREVMEETGISNLTLGPGIRKTYHTYRDRNNKRVLKKTYWYAMKTNQSVLIPQAEENIEAAVWLDLADMQHHRKPIYNTILDVLNFDTQKVKNFLPL